MTRALGRVQGPRYRAALDRCLQRRAFRRQLPPQLEGDLGQAGVDLGYRFDQLPLEFVFGHLPPMRLSVNNGSQPGGGSGHGDP